MTFPFFWDFPHGAGETGAWLPGLGPGSCVGGEGPAAWRTSDAWGEPGGTVPGTVPGRDFVFLEVFP